MVLLEDVGRSRWLSFYLPMNEANRLARVLGKTCCASVPIFDLIGEIAGAGGFELVRAEIDGDGRGVNASLVVRRAGRDLPMVCNPADALARWLDGCVLAISTAGAPPANSPTSPDEPHPRRLARDPPPRPRCGTLWAPEERRGPA